MLQNAIVIALLGGAVFLAGRSMWRTLTGKRSGCGCGSSAGCCSAKSCKTPIVKAGDIQEATSTSEIPNN